MSWTIDNAHSEVNFTVRHMMISNVRGRFEKFTGTVDFDEPDRPTPKLTYRSRPPASAPAMPSAMATCARPISSMQRTIPT